MIGEQLISLASIARRETTRIFRIWVQTLVPPVVTATLYFLIFGTFIGSQLGDVHGYDYMSFIAPGLIMMSIITNSYTNAVSSFFSSKFQRNIEELLVSPTSDWVIVLGYVSGAMVRGLSVGVLVTAVGLGFARIVPHNIFFILVFGVLTSFVFALAGLINGIFAKKFDDISIIPTFVITPLTYLGGVFYSISLLPDFWRALSRANPIIYMIDGFRYGFLGVADIGVWTGLAMLILIGALLFAANLYLLSRGTGVRS